MRSIGAPLTAAQKAATGAPYVTAVVQNNVEHVRRLDFVSLNSTINAPGKHDIAVAGDNSITRVRADAGTIYQQRVAEAAAGTPANWDAWTNFGAGVGTQVACSARGANVIVVYTDAAGTGIFYRESTDNGATFAAQIFLGTVAASVILDLAVAYKNSTGDLMVFWVTTGALLQGNKRTAGTFAGVVTHTSTFATLSGIAATYAFDYELWVTGTEVTTTRPSVWATIYGDGSGAAVGTWTALRPQVQAEAGLTVFQSPSLSYLDTYRANFTELPVGTGGSTRTYRTWLHPTNLYHLGPFSWRTPLPTTHDVSQGLARAHSASFVYESGFDRLQRARHTLVTQDVGPDVLAFELYEDTLDAHGWIELRNTGAYSGPLTTILIGAQVKIAVGYYTTAGDVASPLQDFWITAIEHRRSAGKKPGRGLSTLRLYLEGGLRRLRRSYQRSQIVHDGTIDDFRSVLSGILNRAGMVLSVTTASVRSDTILPKFNVLPTHSGHEAARNLLAFLADRMIARASGSVSLIEPLASETTDYNVSTTHPLYELRLRAEAAPISEAHAISLTAAGVFVIGDSIDFATAEFGTAPIERQRDLTSQTATTTDNTAIAHLRQRKLDEDAGQLSVPPICGLELLDMLDFTDPFVNNAAQLRRVINITWKLDRPRAIYEQQIGLGPP